MATNHDQQNGLSGQDVRLLAGVDDAIAAARQIRAWWQTKAVDGSFADRFELARTFNEPDLGAGFFDTVQLTTGPMRVMGVDQAMHFTWPAVRLPELHSSFREYILHYFLRSSDYSPPSAYYETDKLSWAPFLRPFSWCPNDNLARQGFGYSQLYYKRNDGASGRFPRDKAYRIIDLRALQSDYAWLVASVRILDFNLTFQPLGDRSPQLSFPIGEDTLLVFLPDFVMDRESPEPGVLGEYGFGYALLKSADAKSVLAYGPGHFAAGFQTVYFRLLEDGTTTVRMVFVVNRPEKILDIDFNPVRWGFAAADIMTLGLASRMFGAVRPLLERLPLQIAGFDPITSFVETADVLTNGLSKAFCISTEHLEKFMLMQHFTQHYSMIVSALLTFGQTRNWVDRSSVPAWAIEGISE
jgi:hypothetical protein